MGHDFLQILPDFALCRRIAQQVGRVVRRDQLGTVVIEPFAAEARDALRGLKHRLGRAAAEGTDYFRRDDAKLAEKIRRAGGDFVFFREAIFGRAAFDDVADVAVGALPAHGFDNRRQKLSGAAHERLALFVFVAAGAFADENQRGFRIADAEDDILARFVPLAERAVRADVLAARAG